MSPEPVTTQQAGSNASIPVFIFAGFLGAGKTTLLNHLLQAQHGSTLAVIVNDFGAIPVDAMLIGNRAEGIISMANGCLCCEISGGEFDQALTTLSSIPGVEAIVIEASGVADPGALISMLVRARQHVPVHFGGVVEVVDASEILTTATSHRSLLQRLKDADLIVLNKTDLVDSRHLQKVQEKLTEIAPAVSIISTVKGHVDPRLLFDDRCTTPTAYPDVDYEHNHHHHQHSHIHDAYITVSVPLPRPLHPGRFMDFIGSGTAGAYRVKGFITLAGPTEPENFIFEKAGRHLALRRWFPAQEKYGSEEYAQTGDSGGLVFIGTELDEKEICSQVGECEIREDGGDDVQPGELWAFYPYLDDEADDPNDYYLEDETTNCADEYLVDPDEDPTMLP